ncbi:ABC transporter permease [Aestuariivita boseongensis]|uniref:ABC transporter permease n=1 Tax=Aestuariivita boseongensis TaxID=1470562 RepID=UPI000682A5F6|nr:MlaE family lipid ABC transporter permease subunit [Aestuariivita boseongensis]
MAAPSVSLSLSDYTARISGRLVTNTLGQIDAAFQGLSADGPTLTLDLSGLEALDTGGAYLVVRLRRRLAAEGTEVHISGANPDQMQLIDTVSEALPKDEGQEDLPRGVKEWLEDLGEGTYQGWLSVLSLLSFLGLTLQRFLRMTLQPRRLRMPALVSQMQETGLNAVPIVALMGFLIGVVLSFQGAAQLRQFGAEVFVVDLIAISIFRELGILLTAIIVAGRSGSAFTASIGSMKVREEIDAMRTLGLDPIDVLVLPRVLALVIMLPALGFIANIAGIFGGALMSWIELGVSPGMFITRLYENTDVWHLGVGMIKAPFFAVVIGVVACWRAMQVKGSSESVGRQTTSSVVQSIFLVIALDAAFSIFFSEVGV